VLTGTVQVSVPLDNTNPTSGVERLIQIGSQLDITTLAAAPAIGPRQHDDERSVRDRARRAFSDRQLQQLRGLATALGADLNGSTAVIDLAASGQYDSAKNTFTATRMVVLLSN
jgi:hypothetical protein